MATSHAHFSDQIASTFLLTLAKGVRSWGNPRDGVRSILNREALAGLTPPHRAENSIPSADGSAFQSRSRQLELLGYIDFASNIPLTPGITTNPPSRWRADESAVHRGNTPAVRHGERFDV